MQRIIVDFSDNNYFNSLTRGDFRIFAAPIVYDTLIIIINNNNIFIYIYIYGKIIGQ